MARYLSELPPILCTYMWHTLQDYLLYTSRKKNGLNYIISEHDGIYMPGYDNHHVAGPFERKMVPVIYKNSTKVHAVSKSLANALVNLKLTTNSPAVIPNVVNTELFKYRERERTGKFSFVHVSSLINQKNPEGMLEAMSLVKKKRNDFKLKIIGPVKDRFIKLSKQLSIENEIDFLGEISYNDVAKEISNSDAMIHFTRYETFGCVIAESLCAGIPVIVSDLDTTRELVTDHKNGIMVEEANVQDLADKILYFMESGFTIEAQQIAEENQRKFNYQRVGRMFDELYRSLT